MSPIFVPLKQLKERLNHEFTKTHTSQDYIDALSDGIYSCQFETATALEQWIDIWLNPEYMDYEISRDDYSKGVRFVADEWDKVKKLAVSA